MPRSINKNDAILQRLVFELRYRQGYVYLDKCGRTINAIQQSLPEWHVVDGPNPQQAPLVSTRNGCAFAFGCEKLDLSLEQPIGKPGLSDEDVRIFALQADDIAALVIQQLGLQDFARVGFRTWFLFPTASKADSEEQLKEVFAFRQSDALHKAFNGTQDASSCAVVIAAPDRRYRVSVTGAERQASIDVGSKVLTVRPHNLPKNQREALQGRIKAEKALRYSPEFAIMVDVDAFLEDPPREVLVPKDFILTSYKPLLDRITEAVGQGGT